MKPSELMLLRRKRESVLFITGASGFVGSHIAAALYRGGYRLKLLCRGKNGMSAQERIDKVLSWHQIPIDDRIEVIEGDLCSPLLGLEQEEFSRLAHSVTEVIHCASNTSFLHKEKAKIERTNLDGTCNCIELALMGSCMYFHHISTAYVAGKNVKDCYEEIVVQEAFYNPYESSKYQAEVKMVEKCKGGAIGWSIYRPSIIIGDSESGRALLFSAMYYPVKIVDYLQGLFRKDFLENNGQHARRMGIKLQPDGTLLMPIRIDKGSESSGVINLVTIDYVVKAFMAIYSCDSLNGVYHIVNKRFSTLETLLSYTERYFGVQGITPVNRQVFKDKPKTALERRIDAFIEVYSPYMIDCRRFNTARADAILKAKGIECPEIDYGIFEKCIGYAIENQWRSPVWKGEV